VNGGGGEGGRKVGRGRAEKRKRGKGGRGLILSGAETSAMSVRMSNEETQR